MLRRLPIILICFFLFSSQKSEAQRCAENIDFEQGLLKNWSCDTGRIRSDGSTNVSQSGPVGGRHSVYYNSNAGLDPFGQFPMSCPNGSGYSVQLGNSNTGAQTEEITYTFTIPANANVYSLVYWYAVVFQNPGHAPNEQPRFLVEVSDVTANNLISCGSFTYVVSSNLPGFEESASARQVMFKRWTPVTVNLSRLAGHTIQLRFSTADCTRGGHFGYAYVDVDTDCGNPLKGAGYCRGDDSLVLKAPYGFANYSWYQNNFTEFLSNNPTLKFTPAPIAGSEYAVILEPYPGYGCLDTLRTIVKEGNIPPLVLSNQQLCEKDSIVLNAGFTGNEYSFQWIPDIGLAAANEAASRASPPYTQTYKLKVIDTASGCTREASTDIEVIKVNTAITISGDSLVCGSKPYTAVLTADSSFSIQWERNNTNVTTNSYSYAPKTPGIYRALVTKAHCNIYSRNIEIKHRPAPQMGFAINKDGQCLTGNNFTVTATNPGLYPVTYNWIWGDGKNGRDSIARYNYTASGDYFITEIVKTADGCIDSTKLPVKIYAPPIPSFNAINTCANATSLFNNTSTIATGDVPAYAWTVNAQRSTGINASFTYPRPGLYPVTLKAITDKCSDTVSFTRYVTILSAPAAKKNTINAASGVDTKLETINKGIRYSWSPATFLSSNDTATPVFNGTTATRYLATVTTANECSIIDTIDIKLFSKISVFVPSAFTPNADGKNDRLIPILVGLTELNHFRIWNRWGQLVFEAKTAKPGWDGTVSGIPQLTGTFVWEVSAKDATGKPMVDRGLVTILR